MELEFIEINIPKSKEWYLRRMEELMYVPVLEDDTYNDLFDKILCARDSDEYKAAAKEWVDMNREIDDPEMLNDKILSEPVGDEKLYAIFNLIN